MAANVPDPANLDAAQHTALGVVLTVLAGLVFKLSSRWFSSREKKDARLIELDKHLGEQWRSEFQRKDSEIAKLRKDYETKIAEAVEAIGKNEVYTSRLADLEVRIRRADERADKCEEREKALSARMDALERNH